VAEDPESGAGVPLLPAEDAAPEDAADGSVTDPADVEPSPDGVEPLPEAVELAPDAVASLLDGVEASLEVDGPAPLAPDDVDAPSDDAVGDPLPEDAAGGEPLPDDGVDDVVTAPEVDELPEGPVEVEVEVFSVVVTDVPLPAGACEPVTGAALPLDGDDGYAAAAGVLAADDPDAPPEGADEECSVAGPVAPGVEAAAGGGLATAGVDAGSWGAGGAG
jgi:hypothetical protein